MRAGIPRSTAYEKAIGHPTSNSTVYSLLHRQTVVNILTSNFVFSVGTSLIASVILLLALILIARSSEHLLRKDFREESLHFPRDIERNYDAKKRCGLAELWFVSGRSEAGVLWSTNRLVIHNMHSGIVLRELRWRCWLRLVVPRTSDENTFVDEEMIEGTGETMLLPSNEDQVILCFRVERDDNEDTFSVWLTDKFGNHKSKLAVTSEAFILRYKFRRPSPLLPRLLKHDFFCSYGILLPLDLELLWEYQRHQVSRGVQHALIPITYAFGDPNPGEPTIESSSTV